MKKYEVTQHMKKYYVAQVIYELGYYKNQPSIGDLGNWVESETDVFVLVADTPTELQGRINAMLIEKKPSTEEEILDMMDRTEKVSVKYYTREMGENV
jgi:predicted house-cleaning NTP pyrophosphatase (Maf/HAM1 superfamily)